MNRSDIKKTPGRIVFKASSFLAKLNTAIQAQLVSELFAVGTDAAGELDQRQREAYHRISITPTAGSPAPLPRSSGLTGIRPLAAAFSRTRIFRS